MPACLHGSLKHLQTIFCVCSPLLLLLLYHTAVLNAKQPGTGGGWSFFTLPELGKTVPPSSAAGGGTTAYAAAAAASVQGALAGWMIMAAPQAATQKSVDVPAVNTSGEREVRTVLHSSCDAPPCMILLSH